MRGETDISNASRPIKENELELAEQNGIDFIELPVAYDGLAVIVNPQTDWVDCLTIDELRRIWEPGSTVNNWNQIRPEFPNRELHLYGPGTDSGTYDYFTEAVGGESGASRADFTASEDDNVLVQGIAGDPAGLGFFGLAYYEENQSRLKLLGIDDGDPSNGEGCILPTAETVENGTYSPLSRPLFLYVRRDRSQDEAVKSFVEFYLMNAGVLAPEVGYVALGSEEYSLATDRFGSGVTGSVFSSGARPGVTVEELLRG
jgi:phosphate transport system substrate-binding protein